ncbi:nucleotidyl transferase AbiEii/AbiGii toxin family protein [Patescibacteria group bacterium]|nr:nucleotidyl transferase AbiEii/AbiGii toxin family protein [Patescibacteria group bacterium]
MISILDLQTLSQKLQSTQQNIRREYVQHLFLSNFYQRQNTRHILFKGGTALRIVFNSPRFSGNLDFSSQTYNTKFIKNSIESTLKEIERLGINTNIVESKETTGGYFADITFKLHTSKIPILLQFSKRKANDTQEIVVISNDFIPPYTISLLNRQQLFQEKIQALLTRSKPRDFYDIYFLIRSNLINQSQKQLLSQVKTKLDSSKINFSYELKQFLPKSHWPIIKNFSRNLLTELDKFTFI